MSAPLFSLGHEGQQLLYSCSASLEAQRLRGRVAWQFQHNYGGNACLLHRATGLSCAFSWAYENTSMHAQGKRPVSRGEVHLEFNSGRDKTSFASGAPYHTPPVLFAAVSLLSHTYSLWEPGKGGDLRDRVGMMTWGGGCLVTYTPPPPQAWSPSYGLRLFLVPPTRECYLLNQAPCGEGRPGIPLQAPCPLTSCRRNIFIDSPSKSGLLQTFANKKGRCYQLVGSCAVQRSNARQWVWHQAF